MPFLAIIPQICNLHSKYQWTHYILRLPAWLRVPYSVGWKHSESSKDRELAIPLLIWFWGHSCDSAGYFAAVGHHARHRPNGYIWVHASTLSATKDRCGEWTNHYLVQKVLNKLPKNGLWPQKWFKINFHQFRDKVTSANQALVLQVCLEWHTCLAKESWKCQPKPQPTPLVKIFEGKRRYLATRTFPCFISLNILTSLNICRAMLAVANGSGYLCISTYWWFFWSWAELG